jgi:alcohol dehydrogenase (NADP+)
MKTLRFENGDEMPLLGLGTFKSEPGKIGPIIRKAIEIGYRHFDCAAIYGNEKEIGVALKEAIAAGDVSRKELWITSKLWNNSHLIKDVRPAFLQTLSDLQLDYLDLYLMHWPVAHKPDVTNAKSAEDFLSRNEAPLEETWEGMEDCVDDKLVRHIGLSNCNISVVKDILDCAWIPPEMNQVEMHPFLPQMTLYDYCKENEVHMTAYGPLGAPYRAEGGGGFALSLMENPLIIEIAHKLNCTPAQMLIAWSISRKVAVIPKTVNEDRLVENFNSTDIQIDRDDIRKLSSLPKHRYVDGSMFTMAGSPYNLKDIWEY